MLGLEAGQGLKADVHGSWAVKFGKVCDEVLWSLEAFGQRFLSIQRNQHSHKVCEGSIGSTHEGDKLRHFHLMP